MVDEFEINKLDPNKLEAVNLDPESDEAQRIPELSTTEVKKKVLSITIKDNEVLYAAYMPFLKAGGLFIPTKKKFAMGDLLTLLITLPGSEERHKVESHVVWITPIGSPGNKAGGVGVEFSEDPEGEAFRRKIEDLLGIKLQSHDATHTM